MNIHEEIPGRFVHEHVGQARSIARAVVDHYASRRGIHMLGRMTENERAIHTLTTLRQWVVAMHGIAELPGLHPSASSAPSAVNASQGDE